MQEARVPYGLCRLLLFPLSLLTVVSLTPPPGAAGGPPIEPDGAIRLTTNAAFDGDPAWSPNGQQIAFRSNRGNTGNASDIYQINSDGAGEVQLAEGQNTELGIAGSVDGTGSALDWIGTSGDLTTYEAISTHEFMRFAPPATGTALRTVGNGSDANFTRLLLVPGGLGGSYMAVSEDATKVAWVIRLTQNGVTPVVSEIRWSPLALVNGQNANEFGSVVHHLDSGHFGGMSFSPTGNQLAFSATSAGGLRDIFVYDFTTGKLTALTAFGAAGMFDHVNPSWGADGRIAFARGTNVFIDSDIYVVDADGGGLTRVACGESRDYQPDWAPTGNRLVFESRRGNNNDVYTIDLDPTDNAAQVNTDLDQDVNGCDIDDDNDGCSDFDEVANQSVPKEPQDPLDHTDFPDADRNGSVGFSDFLRLLSAWNSDSQDPSPPWDASVDFNRDSAVNFSDFLILLAGWNRTCI